MPVRMRNSLQWYKKDYLEMGKGNRSGEYSTALECRLGLHDRCQNFF